MIANLDSRDLKGKLNSMVFSTDLSAAAATSVDWWFPGLQSHVTDALSLSLGADLLVCQSQFKRRDGKRNKASLNHPMQTIVKIHKSHN